MADKARPIIVIKKKGGHGGHHGGAWKVAYADFVTALMSLFIVLWLMGSSTKVKKAVAGYFNDPKGTGALLGTTLSGTGEGTAEAIKDASTKQLEELKDKLEKEIQARKELEKLSKQIEITVTPEGLRIELIEGKDGTFYEIGSAKLSTNGQTLLALLGSELKTLPNSLLIEGHTDATPYSSDNSYSNWDLSADRANSARRLLQQDGVRSNQVTQVRGYADQMLRVKNNPTDPSNRRVSILVKNSEETVPLVSAASVVNGTTPLPGSPKAAAAAAKETKAESAKSGEKTAEKSGEKTASKEATTSSAKEGASEAKTTETKQAETKQAATTPAAKPGLMDRLKAMLPGGKKTTGSKPAETKQAESTPAAKPSAATTATKPSLIDRIKAMMPGKK
jgi:chemotaxis protein MotB